MAVLGLGRLGAPIAARLAEQGCEVTAWSRSGGSIDGVRVAGGAAEAVREAEAVLLVLFDAAACADVLAACGPALPPGAAVVNMSTIAPADARALANGLGGRYVHCPVLGSAPAARAGSLTLLVGAPAVPETVEAVLSLLGRPLVCGDAATAAAAKLVANGTLADALVAVGHGLSRARAAGLGPELALDLLERAALGGLVTAKRSHLGGTEASAYFTAGALRKDAALLAALLPRWAPEPADLRPAEVADGADVAAIALAHAGDPVVLHGDARLFGRPGIEHDLALLRPLAAYARGHATGAPAHFRAAFRPTAHVEGIRAGRFVSWDLDAYCANFAGQPAPDEAGRRRTVLELRRSGTVAGAAMLLEHGPDTFVDLFLLVEEQEQWRIANKVYHRA